MDRKFFSAMPFGHVRPLPLHSKTQNPTLGTWYLISRFWRDSISRGFIFAISVGKYEKRALNFAIQAFSTSFYFFKKSELFKISR